MLKGYDYVNNYFNEKKNPSFKFSSSCSLVSHCCVEAAHACDVFGMTSWTWLPKKGGLPLRLTARIFRSAEE